MNEPIMTADCAEAQPQLYLQDGRTLYKVSTTYLEENRLTAIVCWEGDTTPPRTTVRSLSRAKVGTMTLATDRLVDRYHAFLDGQRS